MKTSTFSKSATRAVSEVERLRAVNTELVNAARSALQALKVTPIESVSGTRSAAKIRVVAKRALRAALARAKGET